MASANKTETVKQGAAAYVVLLPSTIETPPSICPQLLGKLTPSKPSQEGELRPHRLATGLCNNHYWCYATMHVEQMGGHMQTLNITHLMQPAQQ
ncbi:hypothetical protein V502_07596 [Pseudogymnoascus sp. VKM F-4520 (FW-2644)]|nr:hypothetical protein V502_07596 [Pseudogymnoascus sp. VKM F-4520 (FW-2644)]